MAFKMKYGKGAFPFKKMDPHGMRKDIAASWKGKVEGLSDKQKSSMTDEDWDKMATSTLTEGGSLGTTDYDFGRTGGTTTHQRKKGDVGTIGKTHQVSDQNLQIIDPGFGSYEYTGGDKFTKDEDIYISDPEGPGRKPVKVKKGEEVDEFQVKHDPESKKYEY